jgi:hypothetical protein
MNIEITEDMITRAVDAYDAFRCKTHGVSEEVGGMSPANKYHIRPLFRAALEAALNESLATES